MESLLQKLMLGGSTAALFAAASISGAQAQDASNVEQVVVSASRIAIAGYQQPTPVTVVGTAQLEQAAHTDIGDSIRELPSVGASASAANGSGAGGVSAGTIGVDTVNLRNLGVTRTLVLFDSQRVVQVNVSGGVDLSTIPTSLVQRIDIVTGGASAAWGSDAVAGVVNLVLNKNFSGLKANLQASDTWNDLYHTYKGEVSYGQDFDGSRGHFIISGSYTENPDVVVETEEPWFNNTFLVANPAYNAKTNPNVPQNINKNNVGFSQATQGGLITASPAGTTAPANALRGIQFVGAGVPQKFNFGNISGGYSWGGDANVNNTENNTTILATPLKSLTLFGYASYKLSDTVHASIQLNYGHADVVGNSKPNIGLGITIKSDNAYIPTSVQATMAAGGITSFTIGTLNMNNFPRNGQPDDFIKNGYWQLDPDLAFGTRQLARGVVTLDGTIGDDWSWNAYYQHGQTRYTERTVSNPRTDRLNLAYDAVTVTAANRGTSGLAVGSIACRDTLTNPTDGCSPLDIFGDNVASQNAIDYVTSRSNPDFEHQILDEDVASGSMQGTLPWQLPAGPVALAFGAEYRKEGGTNSTNPFGLQGLWGSGNFTNFSGQYYIYEGFAEVDAPLIKNGFVQSLDLNMAGRMTSYSTSGLVETWKLGLTSQINDDVRLRTTWSTDIRAPDLQELFAPHAINQGSSIDPKTGQTVKIYTDNKGNAALTPEIALTISGGIVLTPHWIDGLQLSADWYSISIHDAIVQPGVTAIIQQCQLNNAFYCSQLVYNGTTYPGSLGTVINQSINAANQTTSGLDFQADYPMELFSGSLDWHLIGNYTDETTRQFLGTTFDSAGSLGPDSTVTGVPKFRLTLSSTYTEGPWSGTIQGRFIGAARLNNAWTSGVQVDDNDVDPVAYLDLRGSYKWNDNIQFYGAIDNTLNTPPALVTSSSTVSIYTVGQTRQDVYDILGRVLRAGVRFNY